jgi:hypothetical protein
VVRQKKKRKSTFTIGTRFAKIWHKKYRGQRAIVQLRANVKGEWRGWSLAQVFAMPAPRKNPIAKKIDEIKKKKAAKPRRYNFRMSAYLKVYKAGKGGSGRSNAYKGSVYVALCHRGRMVTRPQSVLQRTLTNRKNARSKSVSATWKLTRAQVAQGQIAIWGNIARKKTVQLRGKASSSRQACQRGSKSASQKGVSMFSARDGDRILLYWSLKKR